MNRSSPVEHDSVSDSCLYVLSLFPDLDKMDSEKDEMNQTDIAALHHFYSRHISDLPNDQALTELFAQVSVVIIRSIFRASHS